MTDFDGLQPDRVNKDTLWEFTIRPELNGVGFATLADIPSSSITLVGDITGSGTSPITTTYNGVLPVDKGGTGQTTTDGALNALLPAQGGHAGEVLTTDGSNVSWAAGSGGVTSVSVTTQNGVSAIVTNPTTTPALAFTLGDITPTSVTATGVGSVTPLTDMSYIGPGGWWGLRYGSVDSSFNVDISGINAAGLSINQSGNAIIYGTVAASNLSGTNTGDQTITLTGPITGSGTGSFATTITNNAVTYAKLQDVSATSKLLGSSSTTTPVQELTIGSGLTLTGTTLTADGSGGTVTHFSFVNANGISGIVGNPSTTPSLILTLGAITPSSVASTGAMSCTTLFASNTVTATNAITGGAISSNTTIHAAGAIDGSNLTGTNTGDQTITLTGNVTGSGTGSFATTIANGVVTEAMQLLANNTTNNVSISKHGYAPILPNDATKYLDGTGAYTTPTGTGTVTGTGAAGQATFWTGTSALSGDNAFFWDNTNKRLGLGTATPAYPLHVKSAGINQYQTMAIETTGIGVAASLHFVAPTGGINWTIGSTGTGTGQGAGKLFFYRDDFDASSASMIIDSSANVGIGNTNPTQKLDVTGNGLFSGTLTASNLSGTNTGNQTITLTGDVTGSGTGSFAATIAANAVTTTKINNGAVTEAKITLANNTTNNVTTSAHGFAPILPNDATKYLDGTGAYTVPAGSGGGGTWANISTTKDASDASTTQNIAHGLGTTPKSVTIDCMAFTNAFGQFNSKAIYNGSTQVSYSHYLAIGPSQIVDNSFTLNLNGLGGTQVGVVTWDSTNIIITWTQTGSPLGTYQLLLNVVA